MITLKKLTNEIASVIENDDKKTDIECWNGCGNKELIKTLSVGHLRYDCFKQNIKILILYIKFKRVFLVMLKESDIQV